MASSRIIALAILASLGGAGAAHAQIIHPIAPPTKAAAVPPNLFDCTAEAANVSGFVGSDGSIAIYNVPSGQGPVRVHVTCTDADGKTWPGVSPPVAPVPGGITHFGGLDFGGFVPIAKQLTMSPPSLHLVGLGSTLQLAVGAAFGDLPNGDVTAAATGTTYTSSNPSVATVSAGGLVTAVGAGTAIIHGLNEGASGFAGVSVLPSAIASLSVVPAKLGFALSSVFPTQPAQLHVTASLADASTVDWTPAESGVTYQSSNPSVAVAGIDGAVVGISPGSAVITIVDGPSGVSTQIPVDVIDAEPAPVMACWTSGYAHNVAVDGIWAFVAAGEYGLQILNTNDCSTGGALPLPGKNVIDVYVRGQLAALALHTDGFALVDVSSLAKLHVISTTTSIGAVRDLWISDNVLYVASSNGLFVYDVTNPATPVLVGSQWLGAAVRAVSADTTRGLVVAVTALPSFAVIQMGGAAPWPSATLPLPSSSVVDDVTLFGTSAYVAHGTGGIRQIDVTNPAAPVLLPLPSSPLTLDARGVAVQDTPQGLFVAGADDIFINAVPLFDASLNNTFNVDFSTFPGVIKWDANSTGVALGDGFGVVTTGTYGIQIFRTWPLVDNGGVPPSVAVATPAEGADVPAGLHVFVTAAASDDVAVKSVDLFVDGQLHSSASSAPYNFIFPAGTAGTTRTIQLQATDPGGNVGVSLPVTVNVVTPPPQATGFTVLGGSPVTYSGIDYTVLQVAFNSIDSVGPTWCDDYRSLCQTYGLAPTGCGEPQVNGNDGYGACVSQYLSVGAQDNLGCPPAYVVSLAAQQAGFSDAAYDNSFGFNSCDPVTCKKTMCSGSQCNDALTYMDLTKPYGYTLCAAPPTCSDGYKNQGETNVDCGGPCNASCCFNGVKDTDETGLDCGGPCAACTNQCNDGIKNSDELSIDCGGSFCAPCPTSFGVLDVKTVSFIGDLTVLKVTLNSADSTGATWCDDYNALCQGFGLAPAGCGNYGESPYGGVTPIYTGGCDTQYGAIIPFYSFSCSFLISSLAQQAGFSDAVATNSFVFQTCDAATCQKTMCSGIGCNDALGNIDLTQPHGYTICAPPPSCSDGQQNQGEVGIDCGGPCAKNCCSDGMEDDLETGLDCGGPVCAPCTSMCDDGILNSDELAIDCGGSFCPSCQPFIYTDTPADDVPGDALFQYFWSLTASASDFIYFKVDANGGGGEWCSENAAFYVSSYLGFAGQFLSEPFPFVPSPSSGSWNKYSRPTGGAWSAPDTNGYPNYFGLECFGLGSWCTEWGLGGAFLATAPGSGPFFPGMASDPLKESYASGWSGGAGWKVEINVAATRLEACGF